jgi:hypothetical protein
MLHALVRTPDLLQIQITSCSCPLLFMWLHYAPIWLLQPMHLSQMAP